MPQDFADHLTFLYGATVAGPVESRLRDLVRRHRSERAQAGLTAGAAAADAGGGTDAHDAHDAAAPPAPPRRRPRAAGELALTQRDALLITYGDQVGEPGVAPLQTLGEFLEEHAAGAVSGVHVLPFYPSSSDDGFSVVDHRAVDPALGTWDDVCRLGRRFDLMFDAVFNHVSAHSDWFQGFLRDDPRYRGWFVTVDGDPDLSQVVRPRALPLLTPFQTPSGEKRVWTTFSADQVDVDVRNPDVLLALIDVLLFYVERGARFIRLDAIAYLWKEIGTSCIHLPQTHHAIQLMRAVLDEVAPDVMLITETNVPHRDNVSYFGDGHDEAQLVYNFALPPLVLHSIATANADALARWAASLTTPSAGVTFFNFLASHDGIGVNPVRGILGDGEIDALVQRAPAHGGYVSYKHNPDGSRSPYELNISYFDALSDPAAAEPEETQIRRFLAAQAIMLAMPGMPGIYFHSLFGSRGDRRGAEESGIPRRINRQKFTRSELERELSDPASRRARVLFEMKALLRQRQSSAVFHPNGPCEVVPTDPRVLALRRSSPDGAETVLCLHNVSGDTMRAEGRVLGPYQVLWSPER